ncbi:hypothetical protein GOP47_0020934 [Adiantum capillus-veneris]|uniref:Calcineurin-like phosphoesterase domain-containing protein n=1 Tax=Adiantum capillus-veneris TaxID=13818 RepID=A0A9D4UA44_ADICA|nr:hypothetical protein GOP47_0020934 [Adiantum capillus-veneris]
MIRLRQGVLALLLCCLSSELQLSHAHSEHGTQVIEANRSEGPVWVVQLSDLHFSSYRPQRAFSFRKLLPPLLTLINPSLILITGDLTDGKSKNQAAMRQDESEWTQYKEAVDWVVSKSGLPARIFFDLRGNHDKFGVPEVGGSLDFFSKYSITAQQNRSSSVQSITLQNGDWKHLFVGIDLTMDVGLRGPCNLFGQASNQRLDLLDRQLSQWDSNYQGKVTKIVFGHFPTSFIAGTKDGKRPEEIFVKHKILAYICGHLHYQFGKNLLKHHVSQSMEEFWEWELGDWKENRVIRIMAVDHGLASFLDLSLSDLENLSDDELWASKAFILITHPPDARTMQRHGIDLSAGNSVRALIFSREVVVSAKAFIYDTYLGLQTPIEELTLEQLSIDANNVRYYAASMNFSNYFDASSTRFSLRVIAFDASGKQLASDLRPFSADSQFGKVRWSWMEFFVMGIVWDALYQPLLWANFGILLMILFVPKLYYHLVLERGLFSGFMQNKTGSRTRNFLDEILVRVHNTTTPMWWMQLLLVGYLMCMPWFWGDVLGEGYPFGSMSVSGWSVRITTSGVQKCGLGVPDIIVIVLPFLFHILLPLFVLVFALYAEQALVCEHVWQDSQRSMGPNKQTTPTSSCRVCGRWLRKALLVACLGVAYLHAQRIRAIVGAYGIMAMLISPGYAWPVPFLLVAALLHTARVDSFCSKQKICKKR